CNRDSNQRERERRITILAKNIALLVAGTKINIIDTPGHADFGGEVERVLKMADGALLLVDAAEGPLPQTRFVLRKAFECGLRPIVIINKIDRPDARPVEVLNAVVAGKIRKNQRIALLKHTGRRIDANVKQLFNFDRLGRTETDEVQAGDICAVVGLDEVDIGDTIADVENAVALPPITVDEPTIEMVFRIHDSPFVGLE